MPPSSCDEGKEEPVQEGFGVQDAIQALPALLELNTF